MSQNPNHINSSQENEQTISLPIRLSIVIHQARLECRFSFFDHKTTKRFLSYWFPSNTWSLLDRWPHKGATSSFSDVVVFSNRLDLSQRKVDHPRPAVPGHDFYFSKRFKNQWRICLENSSCCPFAPPSRLPFELPTALVAKTSRDLKRNAENGSTVPKRMDPRIATSPRQKTNKITRSTV